MEYLIKFKIAIDTITKKISDYTQRTNVAYSGEREHLFRPNVNTDSGST